MAWFMANYYVQDGENGYDITYSIKAENLKDAHKEAEKLDTTATWEEKGESSCWRLESVLEVRTLDYAMERIRY